MPLNGVAVGDVTGGYEILKPITSVVETLGQSGGHGHVEHMSSRSVPVKSVLHYAVSEWSFKMSDCTKKNDGLTKYDTKNQCHIDSIQDPCKTIG